MRLLQVKLIFFRIKQKEGGVGLGEGGGRGDVHTRAKDMGGMEEKDGREGWN